MPDKAGEGPDGPVLVEVRFEGVQAVDADDLGAGLANKPPQGCIFIDYARFDAISVELDRRRIQTYYRQRGYFSVEVEGPEQTPGEAPDTLSLTWRIDEGPVTRITAVELDGAPEGLERKLERLVEIEPGERFDHADYLAAKPRLRALLVREGYARAQVVGEVRIDRPKGEAKVVYELAPGPLVHLGALRVTGLSRTPTAAVTRRKTWEDGDVFSPYVLEQMRGRLYELDQYAGVRLDYGDETAGSRADIVARVEEAEQNELQLGGGAGFDRTNVQIRLRARYKRRSFPLPLTNLEVSATPEYSLLREDISQGRFTPQARVTWTWHDFLFPRLQLASDVGWNFRQLEAFTWFGPDVGQTLSRPFLDDRLRAGIGWRFFEYAFSSDLDPATQDTIGVSRAQPVFDLEPSITFDGRDDPLVPRSGVYARVGLELGYGLRSDQGGYTLLAPELRGYLPLGSRLVLAARLRLTTTLSGRLPAPKRLFAGGANSQRGFSQRRLSPTADVTNGENVRTVPIGGQTLLESGVEARLRVVKLFGFWLGLVGFLDGADLVDDLGQLDPVNQHWAAGSGLRYYTPIGAVRLDFGFRLNRRGPSEPQPDDDWAWHLTLGEAF